MNPELGHKMVIRQTRSNKLFEPSSFSYNNTVTAPRLLQRQSGPEQRLQQGKSRASHMDGTTPHTALKQNNTLLDTVVYDRPHSLSE